MSREDALALLYGDDFASLCKQHSVALAVLFGSRAKGQATRGSDIDLAVLMDRNSRAGDSRQCASHGAVLLKDLMIYLHTSALDLVILDRADSLLKFEIAKAGKPVYEATPGSFAEFCSLAVRQHEDSKVFYRAMDRYLARAAKRGG